MTFALIDGARVAQISPDAFPVFSTLTWVDVSQETPQPQCGWSAAQGADGVWQFSEPAIPAVPLAQTAAQMLAMVKSGLWSRYGSMGEAVPQAWITYQQALTAIIDGTDTTSTVLPTQPAG